MQNNIEYKDGLYRISLLGGEARAFLIESTQMCERARALHAMAKTPTAALGRTLTVTSVLGCMLKGKDESVTVRIDGGGPAGVVLAVGQSDGSVKGYVSNPLAEVPRRGEKLDVGALVGKTGMLTVIKDMHMRDPYVGQVHLVSGEIGEDFAMYFTASEQTPSLVSVGVLVADKVVSAGGLIIQLMPGASEAAIRSIEMSAGMFMNISKTMQEYHLDGALEQLLTHLEPEVLEKIDVGYRCDCSREKVENMLLTLGAKELRDMQEKDGGAEVDCHFCNTRRKFSADDLQVLIDRCEAAKAEEAENEKKD